MKYNRIQTCAGSLRWLAWTLCRENTKPTKISTSINRLDSLSHGSRLGSERKVLIRKQLSVTDMETALSSAIRFPSVFLSDIVQLVEFCTEILERLLNQDVSEIRKVIQDCSTEPPFTNEGATTAGSENSEIFSQVL